MRNYFQQRSLLGFMMIGVGVLCIGLFLDLSSVKGGAFSPFTIFIPHVSGHKHPSSSPTPESSKAPSTGGIEPYASAPRCEEHNPHEWHGLWNSEKGCHYDHEHKHDPNEVADIFGPAGEWFEGTSISYPWQTFMGANGHYPSPHDPPHYENETKHENYGWIVRRDIPSLGQPMWIKAFRTQFHAISAPPGTLTRHHSYSLEAQICHDRGCGILKTGGWIDFGNLEVDGYGVVPLPNEEDAVGSQGRRRIHYFHPDQKRRAESHLKAEFFWYGTRARGDGFALPIWNLIALATSDAFSNVDPNYPTAYNFFCPDFSCNKNGSTIQAHVVEIIITPNQALRFNPNSNGIMNFQGYTDRYGQPVSNCAEPALDCIPLIIENLPSMNIQYKDGDHGITTAGVRDFDISPPGVSWIKYPN